MIDLGLLVSFEIKQHAFGLISALFMSYLTILC